MRADLRLERLLRTWGIERRDRLKRGPTCGRQSRVDSKTRRGPESGRLAEAVEVAWVPVVPCCVRDLVQAGARPGTDGRHDDTCDAGHVRLTSGQGAGRGWKLVPELAGHWRNPRRASWCIHSQGPP